MAFKDTKHKGFVSSNYATSGITGNGIHCFGAFEYYQVNDPGGTLDPYTGQVKVLDVATRIGFYSSTDTGSNITEVVADPYSLSISAENATLSNVTVWSDNSILTQARGDTRYQANGSYLNDLNTTVLTSTGTDTLRGVRKSIQSSFGNFVAGSLSFGKGLVGVSSGNEVSAVEFGLGDFLNTLRLRQYKHTLLIADDGISVETGTANWTWSDNSILTQGRGDARYQPVGNYLPAANFTYANIGGTIPTATNTTLGAVKVGSNLTISNGVLSATSSGGFQNGDTLNGGTY